MRITIPNVIKVDRISTNYNYWNVKSNSNKHLVDNYGIILNQKWNCFEPVCTIAKIKTTKIEK